MEAILGSVTDMARQLALQVVVEGVENDKQLALIQSVHCQYVQGYVFSRPLDSARATVLLERGPSLAPAVNTSPLMEDAAPAAPRSPRSMPTYAAAVALLSLAVTAAIFVSRGADADSLDQAPLAPSAASAGVSPGSEPTRPAVAAEPSPREITPATAKSVAAHRENAPVRMAAGATAPASASGAADSAGTASLVTTARVIHQHRLGSCRGVLKASAQGLAFEPEGKASKDAFMFAYRDFVHDLDGETLVLKTSDRTFRFQPVDASGKRDSGELSALLATLSAAR
jgi:hypothetical protein